jgi:membrane fusion protein, macrolide-specific efflux system
MIAAGSNMPHKSPRREAPLRTRLLIGAGVFGIWFVFTTTSGPVADHLPRQTTAPQLATAETRSFPVLATASGVLQLRNGTTFVLRALFSQNEDVLLTSGQAAIVSVDALPGAAFPATVSVIETSATQVGGVSEYSAEIQLGTTDPRLRNGQTGSVNVTIATANSVLAVPSTALFTGPNNQTQVDVWSQGQAYPTTVQIGLVGSTLTEIRSGLQAGEQVLLSQSGTTSPKAVTVAVTRPSW